MSLIQKIETTASTEYGIFTRFLVAHPKTTFFTGIAVAAALGFVAGLIL